MAPGRVYFQKRFEDESPFVKPGMGQNRPPPRFADPPVKVQQVEIDRSWLITEMAPPSELPFDAVQFGHQLPWREARFDLNHHIQELSGSIGFGTGSVR